jgi:hypothetical protein
VTAPALEGKDKQKRAAKAATFDMFMSKRRRTETMRFALGDDTVEITFVSCGRVKYDKLLTSCPPTTAQRADSWSYDQEKFAPKLLAEVITAPEFTEAEWSEIWKSEEWNRGELGDLLNKAVEVCSSGLALDPS